MKNKWIIVLAGLGLIGSGVGCQFQPPIQRIVNTPPAPLNDAPMTIDTATQLRDWNRSTALYANGDTIAGPTGFLYQPRYNQTEWYYGIEETPIFVAQAFALPVVLIFNPPWTEVRYTGETINPTYTAMPALPNTATPTMVEPQAPVAPSEPLPVAPDQTTPARAGRRPRRRRPETRTLPSQLFWEVSCFCISHSRHEN